MKISKEEAQRILKEIPSIKDDLRYFYNYHSNKIENNSLNLGETVTVLKDGFGVAKPLKDIRDIENHDKALNFVFDLAKLGEDISLRNIREIQSLIEPERTGFRRNLAEILNTDVKTAEPFEISQRLESLVNEYNQSNDDFFTKLAKFHIDFERIHPFADGNGRTGRMLMNLELLKEGYPLTSIKFEDRAEYYEAFFDDSYQNMAKLIRKSVDDTFDLIVKKQCEHLNLSPASVEKLMAAIRYQSPEGIAEFEAFARQVAHNHFENPIEHTVDVSLKPKLKL